MIVDTFFKQVVFGSGNRNYYAKEYELTGRLQTFATDNNIGLLLVHHTKKGEVDNISDAILGTTGISGSADTIWLIDKKGGKSVLEIEGKDVEPQSFAMEFVEGLWRFKGSYTVSLLTPEREEILELYKK